MIEWHYGELGEGFGRGIHPCAGRHSTDVLRTILLGIFTGSIGPRVGCSRLMSARIWSVTCMFGSVDPRGRYSNSWQNLVAQLQSLVNDVGLQA
jgi:hypothetical protein